MFQTSFFKGFFSDLFFKGGRVLRLFQYSAALLLFMRRTTISHF